LLIFIDTILVILLLCRIGVSINVIDMVQSRQIHKYRELTIFTALNRFDPTNPILKQAIQSWQNYSKYVVVFVDQESECVALKRVYRSLTLKCLEHQCMNDELKIPTVSCLLLSAEHMATTSLLMYTNSDIIFSSSLSTTVNILSENFYLFDKMVAVGRRTDVNSVVPFPQDIVAYAKKQGTLHSDHGIDYFMYMKGSLPLMKMPPFVVGNIKWDNWLLSELLIRNLTSVVDVTKTVFAVHVGLTKQYVRDRPGFIHNEELWKISRFGSRYIGLGSVSYAGFYTDGMQLVKQNNQHANLIRELFSQLHRSGFLFIITVSKDQLLLLDNWLCWINKINIKKFLIFAMDNTTRIYAEKMNLFTYYPQHNRHDYPIMSTTFEQMSLDEKRFIRGKFLYILLRAGISFICMYPDTIFLSDPPLKVTSAGDVLTHKSAATVNEDNAGGSSSPASSINTGNVISDNFLGLTSSEDGRGERYLRKVLKCGEYKLSLIAQTNSNSHSDNSTSSTQSAAVVTNSTVGIYQSCLNDIYYHELKLKHHVDVIYFNFLDLRIVSGGRAFFEMQLPQSNGFTPAMICADSAVSTAGKIRQLREWHLWLRSESTPVKNNRSIVSVAPVQVSSQRPWFPQCGGGSASRSRYSVFRYVPKNALYNGTSHSAPPPSRTVSSEVAVQEACVGLTIRVLTSDRPVHLGQFVDSLMKAHFVPAGSDDFIDLEVLVNFPQVVSAQAAQEIRRNSTSDYNRVKTMLRMLPAKWNFGAVKAIYFNTSMEAIDLFMRPFVLQRPPSNRCEKSVMVLDDTVRLSPYYYLWTRQVLLKYSSADNPSLLGFSLQRQRLVLGVPKTISVPLVQYLDKNIDRRLSLFSYQLMSSWGQFVYAAHWESVIQWTRAIRREQPSFEPCLPYFFSNRYLLKANNMWSLWFNYYIFYHGLYILYLNYGAHCSEYADCGLLVVHRSEEEQASTRMKQFLDVSLINEPVQLHPAPVAYYPLYDFFFQKVDNEIVLKDRWRFVSNIKDHCIVNDHSKNSVRALRTLTEVSNSTITEQVIDSS